MSIRHDVSLAPSPQACETCLTAVALPADASKLRNHTAPSLSICNVDVALHARLKQHAAAHHRSLEEEVRELLHGAVTRQPQEEYIVDVALRRFGPQHGVELWTPHRAAAHRNARHRTSLSMSTRLILMATNVVFDLTRRQPDSEVVAYLRRQPQTTLFTSSVSEAEIRTDLHGCPPDAGGMSLPDASPCF